MNKKYGWYILVGVIIGATFGPASLAPAIENKSLATALGALGGLFIGWFIAAGIHEKPDKETMKESSITKNEIFFFFMVVSVAVLVSSLIIIQPEWLFR